MPEYRTSSELELLARILPQAQELPHDVVVPNGDDAAVVRVGGALLAISTDCYIEGTHFSFEYFSAAQVGQKCIEAAASDIVAVGGKPRYVVVGVVLPEESSEERLVGCYEGINASLERLACVLLGGNIARAGAALQITVTVLGVVESERKILKRTGAKIGDLVYVSGPLGGSRAGLRALQEKRSGFDTVKQCHLEPRCRIDLVDTLSTIATSLIDVSDGLSSEIHHLCRATGFGADLEWSHIPILGETNQVAHELGESVESYALNGGEDFELLYTVAPENKSRAVGSCIGRITANAEVWLVREDGRRRLEAMGFDHLRR